MSFEIPVRVYIEDTDAGGIVFYGNYLKFFERARTDFLRSIGIEQSVTIENNLIFVVRHIAVDYQTPAHQKHHVTRNEPRGLEHHARPSRPLYTQNQSLANLGKKSDPRALVMTTLYRGGHG